jgi:hypothetical protein
MTLNAAIRRMEREMEFLGVDEFRLHNLLTTSPGMFSSKTLDAWELVLAELEQLAEDSPQ